MLHNCVLFSLSPSLLPLPLSLLPLSLLLLPPSKNSSRIQFNHEIRTLHWYGRTDTLYFASFVSGLERFHCLPRYETLPLPLPHTRRSQFEDEIPPPVPLHTEASTHILEATPTSSDSEHVVLDTGIYYTPTPREFIGTALCSVNACKREIITQFTFLASTHIV